MPFRGRIDRAGKELLNIPAGARAPTQIERPAPVVAVYEEPVDMIRRVLRDTAEEVRTKPSVDLTAALIRLDGIQASANEICVDPKLLGEIKNEIRLIEGCREVQAQILLFPF